MATRKVSNATRFRSGCPIASSLDLFGDRWSLVVLRDLMTGKTRYAQFLESPEGIATNILHARLRALESHGLVTKRVYQARPERYEYSLTRAGAALAPMLQEMCRWAMTHLPDRWTPPDTFMRAKPRDLLRRVQSGA